MGQREGKASQGSTVVEEGERACFHLWGTPSQSLMGNGAFWINQSYSPVPCSRGVLCAMG